MANTLNLFRNGAVGFIDWLGSWVLDPYVAFSHTPEVEDVFRKAFDKDGFAIPHIPIRHQLQSAISVQCPLARNNGVRIGETIR